MFHILRILNLRSLLDNSQFPPLLTDSAKVPESHPGVIWCGKTYVCENVDYLQNAPEKISDLEKEKK